MTDLPLAFLAAVLQSKPLSHQNQLKKDPQLPLAEPLKIDNYTLSENNDKCNKNCLKWKKKKQKMKNVLSKKRNLKGTNSLLKRGKVEQVLSVRVQPSKGRSKLKKNLKKSILTKAWEKVRNPFVLEMYLSTMF